MRTLPVALCIALMLTTPAFAVTPIADVGVDNTQFEECTGFGVAQFQLNGSASFDPEGGPLTHTWTGPFGAATGPTPTVAVPLGAHEITLTVRNELLESATASFTAVVIDTRPPLVDVTLFPSSLVPTGAMTTISAFVDVQDACGAGFSFALHSVANSEPVENSILNANFGAPDTSFDVLATTSSTGGQRTYFVVYEATDSSGNVGKGSAEVVVSPPGFKFFMVNPERMTFDYTIGGPAPGSLAASVTSHFYSSFRVTSTAPWLRASPTTGDAPKDLMVWVNPEGLQPGNHGASLLVSSGGGHLETIQVLLRVFGEPDMFALPETLTLKLDTFSGVESFGLPQDPLVRKVFVGSRRSPAGLSVSTDAPWLQAMVEAPTSPAYITIAANPAGLSEGVHRANVIVAADNPRAEPLLLPVVFEMYSTAEFVAPEYVVHAATMKHLPVAPGSLISAFYFNPLGVTANAEGMPLPTVLGGLSATVEDKPVRFIHVSPTQFNAQLPSELNTGVARMKLYFQGRLMGETVLQIVPAAPGVFMHQGAALALNQDGAINGPANPAKSGSVVSLYLTGQGPTSPSVPDGEAAPAAPFATPALPVAVTVNGKSVTPQFVGLAPGQAGLLQLNLPTGGLSPGPNEVWVGIGGAPSNKAAVYVGQ